MEAVPNLDPRDPEIRLTQFLYVGKEYPDYQTGNRFVHNYFMVKNVPSIEELAEKPEKELVPIEIITKAFESKLVPNPEMLVFALAVCCRQTKSEKLRHAAYVAMQKICVKPEHFILFIKFACQINKQNQIDGTGSSKHGWGQGFRKAVNNWYLSKDPLELAKCVTRCKGRYGWKHKDIIKLSHPEPTTPEIDLVLKYILYGLDTAKKLCEDKSNLETILGYIETIEKFKHCTDESQAAELARLHHLTLDHVPGHLLNSELVWNEIIESMDLATLLSNLQRIHNLKLLKPDSSKFPYISYLLSHADDIGSDMVHPALVLITLKDYENSGKPLTYEKRKMKEILKKPLPVPPKPNAKIVNSLYRLLDTSFDLIVPTHLRYMITIDMHKPMLEGRTWHCGNVTGAEAGCLIALALLRRESHVTVATFRNGIHLTRIGPKSTFSQALRRLQQMPVGNVCLNKPMSWAANHNQKYDVFINVVEYVSENFDTSKEALVAYRNKMSLPNTKLINCAVCSSSTYQRKQRDNNILTINGFDATVPMVIQAFSTSLF